MALQKTMIMLALPRSCCFPSLCLSNTCQDAPVAAFLSNSLTKQRIPRQVLNDPHLLITTWHARLPDATGDDDGVALPCSPPPPTLPTTFAMLPYPPPLLVTLTPYL